MVDVKMWLPTADAVYMCEMGKYLMHVQTSFPDARVVDYDSLHRWSTEEFDTFWRDWLQYSGVIYSGQDEPVLRHQRMPHAEFFPNVRLNFSENLLRHHGEGPAVVGISEARPADTLTHDQLRAEVSRVQQSLQAEGIDAGDRIAAFMPNVSETVVAALATASVGAVWSSCSPDFGVQSVIDRFGQIEPRLLFCVNAYVHNGQIIDCMEKVMEIAQQLPSLQRVVVLPLVAGHRSAAGASADNVVLWQDWIGEPGREIQYERLPFDHPLYIMYSSGTTGVPKCIVHGAGGTLLQQVKELSLHCDVRDGDNITYITTCSWMMWNWLMAGLFTGARITLFDGFPATPSIARLWDLIDSEEITHFGTSPRFLAACKRRLSPCDTHDLSSLRVILSTGAPLLPEEFDWVYQSVKADVQLSSISGGTDIVSCFMLGNPLIPVFRGEIQCLGLGMDVIAADSDFQPLGNQKGELVCCTPFVSMPVAFWNDSDGRKYKDAYFGQKKDCWCHGDLIEMTGSQGDCGGIIVYGRSDATLKPGGVRIGTAEIYRVVESMAEVTDSIVIGHPWRGDIRIVLYIQLHQGTVFNDELAATIREQLSRQASPRHVPALILEVAKIPYTRSGKKVELAVRDIAVGRQPTNREALQDPTSLECYRKL